MKEQKKKKIKKEEKRHSTKKIEKNKKEEKKLKKIKKRKLQQQLKNFEQIDIYCSEQHVRNNMFDEIRLDLVVNIVVNM